MSSDHGNAEQVEHPPLQGGRHPDRRRLNKKGWHYPQQRFLTLWGDVARHRRRRPAPRAALLPLQHRRHDRVLAHQPGPHLLRARRLPGPHADRRHRPAHPPREVRRDLLRRRRPTASTTRTAPSAPTRSATGSTRSMRTGRVGLSDVRPETQFVQPGEPRSVTVRGRSRTTSDVRRIFGPPPAGQNWDGAQTTIQRWDTDPLLDNNGRRPHPADRLHPRPLRALDPPAGRASTPACSSSRRTRPGTCPTAGG